MLFNNKFFIYVIPLLALLGHSLTGYALPALPVTMIVNGQIEGNKKTDSQILAFDALGGQLIGSASVMPDGAFALVLSNNRSFNGNLVVLEILQDSQRFQLLKDNLVFWFRFKGDTFPERGPRILLKLGPKTVVLTSEASSQAKIQRLNKAPDIPCVPEIDVNGDGKCNEGDWSVIRLYGGGVTRSIARP